MRDAIILLSRALMIALAFSVLGIAANLASHDPVSLVYAPPRETVISNVKLILIDEKEAVQYLKDPGAVFVDCREFEDYQKSHIQKALCLPPDDFENRFPALETLLPLESKIILYCYGPTCDMAEKVGVSLGQMGYMNLMIMSSGFPAWEQAKFPIEIANEKGAVFDDIFDGIIEDEKSCV
jgi:rhodanese-related sulfurtransferase